MSSSRLDKQEFIFTEDQERRTRHHGRLRNQFGIDGACIPVAWDRVESTRWRREVLFCAIRNVDAGSYSTLT